MKFFNDEQKIKGLKESDFLNSRYAMFFLFTGLFIAISFLTRSILAVYSFGDLDKSIWDLIKVIFTGFFYDGITAMYFLIPFAIFLTIIPEFLYKNRFSYILFLLIYLGYSFLLLYNSTAEFLFWEEFGVRFNFIAVDYLVYTYEVAGNIKESYNLPLILSVLFVLSVIITFLSYKKIRLYTFNSTEAKTKFKFTLSYIFVFIFSFLMINSSYFRISDNVFNNELSHNGIYEFFHAFRNNTLDYMTYYQNLSDPVGGLRELNGNKRYISEEKNDITRVFKSDFPDNKNKKLNVILITIESMSGEFMGRFGNKENITPNLDRLSKEGLFFTNLFATGTRTVRGMEAITLSIPPTPGRSIVKRPGNENLNSIGFILKDKGYKPEFLYSGYGYFDNMNYFYSNNGFDIVDRTAIPKSEISFANIWGVCDQDLFAKTIKEADRLNKAKQPFYFHVMTTSNHRPYTYPEGLIDIPSGSGRSGAVKYTDYAIGEFIDKIKDKEWMKNTVVVITADHCASSAGKTTLNTLKYHIPMIIYSPGNINSGNFDKLCSQVDIAPTILDILGLDYTSKFYGESIFSNDFKERAFIGNYQSLGLLSPYGELSVLSTGKRHENFFVDFDDNYKTVNTWEKYPGLYKDNIIYYQSADYLYKNDFYLYKRQKNFGGREKITMAR